jgi:hypothetical protein
MFDAALWTAQQVTNCYYGLTVKNWGVGYSNFNDAYSWTAKFILSAGIDHPTTSGTYTNVSGTLFGPNGPPYLDVQQGGIGDCWLLSSLAETAARDPQDIRSMFTADGTTLENGCIVNVYTVRFFENGVAKYVVVDTELPNCWNHDQPVNSVLWVALAEKAYAEANGLGYVTTGSPDVDSYAALNGGAPAWALRAITGKLATDFAINPNNIAAAWGKGELIVLTTSKPVSQYIVGDHCYAVVGYNGFALMPFQLFNPWGTDSSGWAPSLFNNHKVYGLVWENATFLSQNFSGQSFGIGAAAGAETAGVKIGTQLAAEAAMDLVLAGWGT